MTIYTLSGSKDTIDAFIVAAQMEGLWNFGESVAHYQWNGAWHLYRMTGMASQQILDWDRLVQLSCKFRGMKRVGMTVYDF